METNNLFIGALEEIKNVVAEHSDPALLPLYLGIIKTTQVLVAMLDEEYLQKLIVSAREAQRELEMEGIPEGAEMKEIDDLMARLNRETKQ
jgi:hypothetical protein